MLLVGSETLVENQQLEPLSMLGNKAHVNCTNWDGQLPSISQSVLDT